MPELPEVETTARGIAPHIMQRRIVEVIVRHSQLRWPVPTNLRAELVGHSITRVERRAKYLLLRTDTGTFIVHLGMSGSLRVLPAATAPQKHDHLDIVFDDGQCLRLRDPRRFGAALWTRDDPAQHVLLKDLGPEPLSDEFNGAYLFTRARRRKVGVKQFLMDGKIVVGVGNIYANEALFLSGIHPRCAAGRISQVRYTALAENVKRVLRSAIGQGGTTLRDYVRSTGDIGYFQLQLNVYGRTGEPCPRCGATIKHIWQGQRSTFYCTRCQHR